MQFQKVSNFLLIVFIISMMFSSIHLISATTSKQITGKIQIIAFQEIEAGGAATFNTSEGETLTLTLPQGQSASLTVQTTEVQEPTSGGINIQFLAEVVTLDLQPPDACLNLCNFFVTFTDDHLVAAGISDPNDVVIFQDPEQDGTFVALPTILSDGAPSPYTVVATITSTSFFGIGVLGEETFCGKTLEQWEAEGANIIFGTDNRDKLRGTKNVDVIFGLDGNDRILGKDGDDCLIGGKGNDRLIGGKGNDIIFGNEGNDRLHGGRGNDFIDAGNGDDRITGNKGNDLMSGGDGDDKIIGNKGDDSLFGISGDDEIRGKQGNDYIDGGTGFDECRGGDGIDTIVNCEEEEDDDD